MAFRDLRDIIGPLELPIAGKVYKLPVVSAADGARIRIATEHAAAGKKDEIPPAELERIVLGDVLAEMRADKLSPEEIDRVFFTGLADVQRGRVVAEIIWEQGVDPKAIQAAQEAAQTNRAARRKSTKTRTVAATTTQRRASGSGTKTPQK